MIPAPYLALFVLARSDSRIIIQQNYINHIHLFPYDNILFTPNNKCCTCQFSKSVRSKHCEAYNACVARHDHHCLPSQFDTPTYSRCMDRKLCRIFQHSSLLFLFINASLLAYGTYLHYIIFSYPVVRIRIF